jgi:hypothetical protein
MICNLGKGVTTRQFAANALEHQHHGQFRRQAKNLSAVITLLARGNGIIGPASEERLGEIIGRM